MSDDLVNLAQRWPERAATHYEGCEADHVGCLLKKLAREVERLKALLPPTAHTGVHNGPGEGSWSVFAGKVVEERDAAQAEVERLWRDLTEADGTIDRLRAELTEQDHKLETAQAEVERLKAEVKRQKAERDQMATHPKGREVGRFGLDGHYLYGMEPARPSDEDIWREVFITMLPSFPWEKAAEKSDCVLVEYRKRWPR